MSLLLRVSHQLELLEGVVREFMHLRSERGSEASYQNVADLLCDAGHSSWAVGPGLGVAHVVDEGEVEALLGHAEVLSHVEVPAVRVGDHVGKLIVHREHVQIFYLEINNEFDKRFR